MVLSKINASSPVACLFIPLLGMVAQKIHSPSRRLDGLTGCHVLRSPAEPEFFSIRTASSTHSTDGYGSNPDGPPTGAQRQKLSASRIQARFLELPPPSEFNSPPRSSLLARGYHQSISITLSYHPIHRPVSPNGL